MTIVSLRTFERAFDRAAPALLLALGLVSAAAFVLIGA